jgi:hypothetical protein
VLSDGTCRSPLLVNASIKRVAAPPGNVAHDGGQYEQTSLSLQKQGQQAWTKDRMGKRIPTVQAQAAASLSVTG